MADIDLSDFTILSFRKSFNPDSAYNRVYVINDDGVYSMSGTGEDAPLIEYFESGFPNGKDIGAYSADLLNRFVYSRYTYEVKVAGMDIRLMHTVDIDSVLVSLGLEESGVDWRVTDISYDITPSGPSTTFTLSDNSYNWRGASKAGALGRDSFEKVLDKSMRSIVRKEGVHATKYGTVLSVDESDTSAIAELPGGDSVKGYYIEALKPEVGDTVLIIPQGAPPNQNNFFFVRAGRTYQDTSIINASPFSGWNSPSSTVTFGSNEGTTTSPIYDYNTPARYPFGNDPDSGFGISFGTSIQENLSKVTSVKFTVEAYDMKDTITTTGGAYMYYISIPSIGGRRSDLSSASPSSSSSVEFALSSEDIDFIQSAGGGSQTATVYFYLGCIVPPYPNSGVGGVVGTIYATNVSAKYRL